MLTRIKKELESYKNAEKIKVLSSFFKTGKGQYGEGDIFLGVTVPLQRRIAKKYSDASLKDLQDLLSSRIHEYRLTSLLILTARYGKADELEKEKIVKFYLKNTANINNWDLVDLSAPNILGNYLLDKDKSVL